MNNLLTNLYAEILAVETSIQESEDKMRSLEGVKLDIEKVKDNSTKGIQVLSAALSDTQQEIIAFIEKVVTIALQYVYNDSYGFECKFETRRNQLELDMYPTIDGYRYNPKFHCGVGLPDVCSFALRIACWSISKNRTLPMLFFDQPFRNISSVSQVRKCAMMVKELSNMLGIQIIIISGDSELKDYADNVYEIMLEGKISKIVNI